MLSLLLSRFLSARKSSAGIDHERRRAALAVEALESRLVMAGSFEIAYLGNLGADYKGPTQVYLAGGTNPIPEDKWEGYDPPDGYIKNTTRNAQLSWQDVLTSPDSADSETYITTSEGYTWLFVAQIVSANWPFDPTDYEDSDVTFESGYHVAALTTTPPDGVIKYSANTKNADVTWYEKDENGQPIERYFIRDSWGSLYIMQTSGVTNQDDVKDNFFSAVLPSGWVMFSGFLKQDLKTSPAYDSDGFAQFNIFRTSSDDAFQQITWGDRGVGIAQQIPDMTIWGGSTSNEIVGRRDLPNVIYGAEGNDRIVALGTIDQIHGDSGLDTVVFKGNRSQYIVTNLSDDPSIIEVRTRGEDADARVATLYDVEFLKFQDRDEQPALEALENRLNPSSGYGANPVHQLYARLLHRNADSAGLANWTAKLESGQANLAQVAQYFIHSPEAVRNNVTQAYTQYLNRSPDPGGLSHYTAVSDGGYNQGWVSASVLGSDEFAQKSAPTDAAFVSALYGKVLGRAADEQGYASNLAALQRGATRTELAYSFLTSPEHTASLVQKAYFAFLGRNGSPQEVEGWVAVAGRLRGGVLGVMPLIAGSPEGVAYLSANPGYGTSPQYTYSIYNLINNSEYYLVFLDGTQQGGQDLQPAQPSVLTPNGGSYGYSIFDTYSIDVRTDSGDSTTSIGTAAVETRVDSNGNRYLYDTTGLLNFNYSADDSSNLNYAPYYIAGQLITVNESTPIPSSTIWGWNNNSPYDIKLTAISGTGASPAVGTVIASGSGLGGIVGTNFEFDILAADGTEVLGHSVIATGSNGYDYLYDTNNLALFTYNSADSTASGWKTNWQDLTLNLAPPVISNTGWTSGMGNTDSVAKPGGSVWGIDYGSEVGRWTIQDGAASQSNAPIDYPGGTNYGSRAFPVTLDDNFQASYGPGCGFDGLWQMDIRIGSSGSSDNSFCETFYLAERVNPSVGVPYYSDGSPNGGGSEEIPGPWSREIDIMETRWNAGGTKVGPQINLPTGQGNGGPFSGWTTDPTYYNTVLGEWSDIDAPNEQFATFGILIRGNSLWIYAYKPDGSYWYSTEEIVKNSDWNQVGEFVPYIGTWANPEILGDATIDERFTTGYKNFVYLAANDASIAGRNPKDNPSAFGQALIGTHKGIGVDTGYAPVENAFAPVDINITPKAP